MSEETINQKQKRRSTYLEITKLNVKLEAVERKIIEISSVLNDLDFKADKLFEALNRQSEQLLVLEGTLESFKFYLEPIGKPQQIKDLILPEEISRYMNGDGWIQPFIYNPEQYSEW